MNKSGNIFKKHVIQKHITVTAVLLGVIIFTAWFMDNIANHFVIDYINKVFSWEIASFIKDNKYYAVLAGVVICLAVGWIIVELQEISKVSAMLDKVEFSLRKDDEIRLDSQFKTMEDTLNVFREQNHLNAQRAQIEVERKNDLITYLAHDIRTPLASIIGYLSLLDEIPDIPVEQRAKYVGITLKKAYRLEELINEFFDITRFNLSSLPLEKEELPLKFLLEQLVEEFYPMLTVGGRKVHLEIPEGMTLYGDADKLARVFSNLVKNAVSYSYKNSTIVVKAWIDDKNAVITITNQGKQIPREKLNMIFDKFFRLDGARSTETGGAGLGLAIAKEIVTQHGGQITAESNENSTVFTVFLPA